MSDDEAKRPFYPKKRNKFQRMHDLAVVSEMYCQGKSQLEIGKKLGITQQQVSNDLASIKKEWARRRINSYTDLQNAELAKIDLAERQAWEAWWRSCEAEETQTAKQIGGRNSRSETGIRTKQKVGDPRFLELALKCVEKRIDLMGLNAPSRSVALNLNGDEQKFDSKVMSSSERKQLLAEILLDCGATQLLAVRAANENKLSEGDIQEAQVVEVIRD